MLKWFLFVFLLPNNSSAAILFKTGKCLDVQVLNYFNVDLFLGTWYEYARYPVLVDFGGDCSTIHFYKNVDGSLSYDISQVTPLTKKPKFGKGTINFHGPSNIAKFNITYKLYPGIQIPFSVIDTDYHSYAVVYSCIQFSYDFNIQFCSILTRARQPSPVTIAKANKVIQKSGIDKSKFEIVNQKFCSLTDTSSKHLNNFNK